MSEIEAIGEVNVIDQTEDVDIEKLVRDLSHPDESLMEGDTWDIKELVKSYGEQPLGENLVLRRRQYRVTTKSGLLVSVRNVEDALRSKNPKLSANNEESYAAQGMVISVGPDVKNIKPKDEIRIEKHCGKFVAGQDGNKYYILNQRHVISLVGITDRKMETEEERLIRINRQSRGLS